MNLTEAKKLYEAGKASLPELAEVTGLDRSTITKQFRREGVEIRTRGGGAIHLIGDPPKPKPCVYGCGRTATSSHTLTCVPCALAPPCTCGKRFVPARKYGSQWACLRCGLLSRGER